MRYFNTSGQNIIKEHYTLMRPKLVAQALDKIRREQYLTIWTPHLAGKSTFFNLLTNKLEEEGYKVAYVNFQGFETATLEDFLTEFHIRLYQCCGLSVKVNSIQSLFTDMTQIKNLKLVLIIDAVDGINYRFLEDLLLSIRVAFHSRAEQSLKSVILGSVSNVLSLAHDMRGSYNISDDFDLPYFSDAETLELLAQHEIETGQLFDPSVKAKISEITANQPGLVSGLAAKLVDNNPLKPVINYDDYLLAEKQYLSDLMDKDSTKIISKAKKYRSFIERRLFTDSSVRFQILQEHIRELFFYGIIAHDDDYYINFRVPLYEKCLHQAFYPSVKDEIKRIQKNIDSSAYFTSEGFSMPKLIETYKKYVSKAGFGYFLERDKNGKAVSIKEAALIYSFETYINAFLDVVGGTSYRDAHTNLNGVDTIITINGEKALVKNTVYQHVRLLNEAKEQVADYAHKLGLNTATYMVFVNSEVTNEYIVEKSDFFNDKNVRVTTYLIRYDLETDF